MNTSIDKNVKIDTMILANLTVGLSAEAIRDIFFFVKGVESQDIMRDPKLARESSTRGEADRQDAR